MRPSNGEVEGSPGSARLSADMEVVHGPLQRLLDRIEKPPNSVISRGIRLI